MAGSGVGMMMLRREAGAGGVGRQRLSAVGRQRQVLQWQEGQGVGMQVAWPCLPHALQGTNPKQEAPLLAAT